MDHFLNPFKIVIEKYQSILNHIAEVSKPGQPRGTQDPHIGNPFFQEFVGSNPTLCTTLFKLKWTKSKNIKKLYCK